MRLLVNILWLILGGLWMALAYAVAGLISLVFIITIPFGVQSFKLAGFGNLQRSKALNMCDLGGCTVLSVRTRSASTTPWAKVVA